MFYLIWIISAFVAVGVGLYAVFKVDKHDETSAESSTNHRS